MNTLLPGFGPVAAGATASPTPGTAPATFAGDNAFGDVPFLSLLQAALFANAVPVPIQPTPALTDAALSVPTASVAPTQTLLTSDTEAGTAATGAMATGELAGLLAAPTAADLSAPAASGPLSPEGAEAEAPSQPAPQVPVDLRQAVQPSLPEQTAVPTPVQPQATPRATMVVPERGANPAFATPRQPPKTDFPALPATPAWGDNALLAWDGMAGAGSALPVMPLEVGMPPAEQAAPAPAADLVALPASATPVPAHTGLQGDSSGLQQVATPEAHPRTPSDLLGRPSAPAETVPDQISQGIVGHARLVERGGETEFVLELHPPELGKLQVHLRSTPEGLSAHLRVAEEGARLLIEGQVEQLRQRLNEAACPVVRCSVGDLGGQWQPRQQQQAWQQPQQPPSRYLPAVTVGALSLGEDPDRLDVVA